MYIFPTQKFIPSTYILLTIQILYSTFKIQDAAKTLKEKEPVNFLFGNVQQYSTDLQKLARRMNRPKNDFLQLSSISKKIDTTETVFTHIRKEGT